MLLISKDRKGTIKKDALDLRSLIPSSRAFRRDQALEEWVHNSRF
jgi:hypothetical protein